MDQVSIFFFWLHCAACGILVPQPGIETVPSALRVYAGLKCEIEQDLATDVLWGIMAWISGSGGGGGEGLCFWFLTWVAGGAVYWRQEHRTRNCLWEDDFFSFGLLSLCVCGLSRWKFIMSVWEEDVDVIGFRPTGGTWSFRNEWNYQGKR